jgi:hypothetical protein
MLKLKLLKIDRVDQLVKLGLLAFWVFVIGMIATNEKFQAAVLHPFTVS